MSSAFYELFGQIGATVVTVAFSLFIAYLLYLKEQRDKIGNQIIGLKREILSIFKKLLETPIPGVSHSLTSKKPDKIKKLEALSLTRLTAGVSWEMRAGVNSMSSHEVWDEVRKGLENLIRGFLSSAFFPPIEKDSESFREWGNRFVDNTEHFRWFTHDYAGHSWAKSFLEKLREWENIHPNPVLKSQDVALLFDRLKILRQLIVKDLLLESEYQNLKVENSIKDYKWVIVGFLSMGFSSMFLPLVMLLFPPTNGNYIVNIGRSVVSIYVIHISIAILALFFISSILVMSLLLRTSKK